VTDLIDHTWPIREPLIAARRYARLGWSVIPAQPRGKQPLVRWKTFQARRAAGDEIAEWFQLWPAANVAVVTGAISEIVVLDLDPKHGAMASVEQLERQHGRLPKTVSAVSGGGGWHLYFAHPGSVVRNRVGLAPGVDLRGDGGLIVAPPSIHPSGAPYRWQNPPGSCALAPLPDWLRGTRVGPTQRVGRPPEHWRQVVNQGVAEGKRNNTVASLAGHLLWRGVDADVTLEMLLGWNRTRCRPPLDDSEVVRTVQSIVRLHGSRRAA